jgi:hypothetical protein
MGDQAGNALTFQPKLAAGLGDTVQQLLDAEGLLPVKGNGAGNGAGGGYSQRRSTLNNVGLYGGRPAFAGRPARAGGSRSGPGRSGAGGRDAPDSPNPGAPGIDQYNTSAESSAAVPPRYKKKVGQYFDRVADELGDER